MQIGPQQYPFNDLSKYAAADLDEGTTSYYGLTDVAGAWVIVRVTSTTVRYASGNKNYAANWTNRASLSYDYLSKTKLY